MPTTAPLSVTQRDLYLDHLRDPAGTIYSLGVSLPLGRIDAARWLAAAADVLAAEPATRIRFAMRGGDPIQLVDAPQFSSEVVRLDDPAIVDPPPIGAEVVSHGDPPSSVGAEVVALGDPTQLADAPQLGSEAVPLLERFIATRVKVPYDLARGPLVSHYLLAIAGGEHTAVLAAPHILLDAQSCKLVLERICRRYDGAGIEEPRSFVDYVPAAPSFDTAAIEAYWRRRLSAIRTTGAHTAPRIRAVEVDGAGNPAGPTSSERCSPLSSGHVARRAMLSREESAQVRALCERRGFTPPTFFRALWSLAVERYVDGAGDLAFYEVLGGRPADERTTAGCFYHVVPTVVPRALAASGSPAALWRYLADYRRALGANLHVSVALQSQLAPEATRFYFNYYTFSIVDTPNGRALLEVHDSFPADEIHLIVRDLGDRFELVVFDATGLLADTRGADRLVELAHRLLADEELDLAALDLLAPGERELQLVTWNAAGPATSPDARQPASDRRRPLALDDDHAAEPGPLLPERIASQIARTPDAIAITAGDDSLTYAELGRRIERAAAALAARGVGPDVIVGVCLERGLDLVVAVLAVLRAGGAYLPLDPELPAARLELMASDAGARRIIGRDPSALDLAALVAEEPRAPARPVLRGDHLAYVIYTSGSTGQPKGVMSTHAGLANRIAWMQDRFALTAADVVLHKTPFGFDVSVWELVWPPAYGARMVVARPGGHRDPDYLSRLIDRESVTTLHFVPSMLQAYLARPRPTPNPSLRRVVCSGEALGADVAASFHARCTGELHNLYGPTEASIDVSHWACARDAALATVPIGRPITGIRLRILDDSSRLLPVGVAGELCIGGVGLARGYLDRPDLTAAAFVPDPFEPGQRLYRTGDLARYLPDGAIEFLGRRDHQVKLRGFRIELGEIETALRRAPGIRDAAVAMIAAAGDEPRLVAYLVASAPAATAALAGLRGQLPEYMVPSAHVTLDALPLGPSGKLDRKALPAPAAARRALAAEAVPPRTPLEAQLAAVWSELLGVTDLGVLDDFFALGGSSLLALRMVSLLYQRTGLEVEIDRVFRARTIAGLAQAIAARRDTGERGPAAGDRTDPVTLGPAQESVWLIERFHPACRAYQFQARLDLAGPLDVAALERSLEEVVRRHESLRTTYPTVDGLPVQQIHPPGPIRLPVVDLTGLAPALCDRALDEHIASELHRPFDLTALPLVRWSLVRLAPDRHVFLNVEHHVVHDGASINCLLGELVAAYRAYASGGEPVLPPPMQYADYASWQQRWLSGDDAREQLAYWAGRLAGAAPTLDLPTDRPRPAEQSFRGSSLRLEWPRELCDRLRELSRAEGVTLFMTMAAAFVALLHRYTGKHDLSIGTAVANRPSPLLERMIGMVVNTVVLRSDLTGNPSFRQFLARMRDTALDAYAHQSIPFRKVVEAIAPRIDPSYSPLYQVAFSFHDSPPAALDFPGLTARLTEGLSNGTAKFDMNVVGIPRFAPGGESAGMTIVWEYCTELFDRATVVRMSEHYHRMLHEVLADPGQLISELRMVDDREHALLDAWNATARDYGDGLVHQLFEDQVARTPDHVALVFEGTAVTYGELDRRANRLANLLVARGVGPEVLVPISMERSIEMIVSLFAILKAGGAYVPIDPDFPRERVDFMLDETGAGLLLTQRRLRDRFGERAGILCVDELDPTAGDATRPRCELSPDHLIYVIYTSGSTGRPKGAMNTHRGVRNRMRCLQDDHRLTSHDRLLQKTTFNFDVSVWEVFWTLSTGAALVIARPGGQQDTAYLASLIAAERVTTVHFLPVMLRLFLDEPAVATCTSLRQVMCSGEALPIELQQLFAHRLPCELHNLYGPTETSIEASYWTCRPDSRLSSVPIGRPVANTRLYILDHAMNPVPIGVAGELYIGGLGVGRGYWRRPDLTAERFVPDPFDAAGRVLYRTGDLCRHLPDGVIEFLGRIDNQVKVRGFRMELGEIEAVLRAHPAVQEAVVLALEYAPGEKRLVAYVVCARDRAAPTTTELAQHASAKLPEYMVPPVFLVLPEMPMTPTGKIDRRALPAPPATRSDDTAAIEPPRDRFETELLAIWEDLLGVHPIGLQEDFFQLGGTSILALRLRHRIEHKVGYAIPLTTLFEARTIEQMALALKRSAPPRWSPIITLQSAGDGPPLFLLHPIGGDAVTYLTLTRHLGARRPIHGFDLYGQDYFHARIQAGTAELATIEQMATDFVDAMLAVYPRGPYRLCGYSMAGLLTIECARLLRARGHQVDYVGLLGTVIPSLAPGEQRLEFNGPSIAGFLNAMFGRQYPVLRELLELDPDAQLARSLEFARELRIVPPDFDVARAEAKFLSWNAGIEVSESYRARPIDAHLTVVVPERHAADPCMDWSAYASSVDVFVVPGDHTTLTIDHAAATAAAINASLERVERS